MRDFSYGVTSNATMDPKSFVLQAIKKCKLNNKIILENIDAENTQMIEARILNTTQLINGIYMSLNKEDENKIVNDVLTLLEWIELEINNLSNEGYKKNPGTSKQTIKDINRVLGNLYDGFEGMID